jgi:hypothetical protein
MKRLSLLALISISLIPCFAQEEKKKDIGTLSGSFESYNQLYQKDSATGALVPQDKIGSNNFLKLDYQYKNFTAGVQFESYLPKLLGYPGNMEGSKLINKYFNYRNKNLSITVGDFYEQFGNGLIFRSFENRQIGINNAIEGVNVRFQPVPALDVKVIYGKQRRFFEFSDGVVRGLDAELDWTKLKKLPASAPAPTQRFSTGFSIINRYDPYTGANPRIRANTDAWAARFDYSSPKFYINGEWVNKGRDAHLVNNFYTTKGKALLLNTGFSKNRLGINLTLRRLENMDFRTDRDAIQGEYLVNYLPALTRQHDYALSNIYVYNAQAIGEIGGQADLIYKFAKGSGIGGKYGATLSVNYARYNALNITNTNAEGFSSKFLSAGKQQFFGDLNIEFRKKWSAKTTTTFFYQNLFYNKSIVEGGLYDNVVANIVVADVQVKYAPKKAVRFEAQHLYAKQDFRSWAAALAELSFAPRWTVFAQDLYNYNNPKGSIHYYTVGTSFTYTTTRLLLTYGRQRAGLVCVGGVCRLVPAATGLNATLTTSF